MPLVLNQNRLLPSLIRDANANMKLKNLFEFLFIITPINPPNVVPKVPKNNPNKVVLNISFKIKTP